MRRVTLYSRPGCHLCDEAREMLAPILAEAGDLVLEEIDIDSDEALLRLYLERIPVIEVEGVVVGELVPDAIALRSSLLNQAAR